MPLTQIEKDQLMEIIEVSFGYNSKISAFKDNFNDYTVEVVEQALEALSECSVTLKQLILSVVSVGTLMTKGWLKKFLGDVYNAIRNEKVKLSGAGCRFSTISKWQSEIVNTAI